MSMAAAVESTRLTGTVSRFNNQKGYGFIEPDDGTEDLFVHQSEIKSDGFRSLYKGQKVEFTVTANGDKFQAVAITGIGGLDLDSDRKNSAGWVRGSNGNGGSNRKGGGSGECYNCGRVGHMAKDCDHDSDRDRSGRGGGVCYNCGVPGHLAKDCDKNIGAGACYTCGEVGHLSRDCEQNGGSSRGGSGSGGSDRACYSCGGIGHFSRDCPSGRRVGGGGGGACYTCGATGHLARDCPRESRGGFARSGNKCFQCGEAGHFARDCTSTASVK